MRDERTSIGRGVRKEGRLVQARGRKNGASKEWLEEERRESRGSGREVYRSDVDSKYGEEERKDEEHGVPSQWRQERGGGGRARDGTGASGRHSALVRLLGQ